MGDSVFFDKCCTDFTVFEAWRYVQVNVSSDRPMDVKTSWRFIKYLFPFIEYDIKGCPICTNRMLHWSLNIV